MSVPWQMGVAIFFGSMLGKHLDVKYQTETPVFNAFFTLLALWFAARNDHKVWFLACGLVQLFGLVEIIYLACKTSFFKDFKLNG